MVRRTDTTPQIQNLADVRPEKDVLSLLTRKNALQLIYIVGELDGARFSDIEYGFGDVSSSTLTARLADFETAGFLARRQYDELPPRVEYELTPSGEELYERVQPLFEWISEQ